MISNDTNNNNELWKTVIVTKFSKTTIAIFFNIFQLFHLKPSSNFLSCYFNKFFTQFGGSSLCLNFDKFRDTASFTVKPQVTQALW